MRQILAVCLSLLLLLTIQQTFLPVWLFSGAKLDLLLVATVCTGLLYGRGKGVAVGFFAGLMQDLLSGFLFGYHILTRMLCGFLCGLTEKQIFKENPLIPVFAAALATILAQLVYWMSAYLAGAAFSAGQAALVSLLLSSIDNGLLAWPVYQFLRWLFRVSETK